MAEKLFFESTATKKRFEVLSIEGTTITLKSENGVFTETYDKVRFKEMGYTLIKVPIPDTTEAEADDED
jgi:hypothetical protein